MPKTSKRLPEDNTAVRFRVAGDKHMHTGTYTTVSGFEVCNAFLCYTLDEVDYWREDTLDMPNPDFVQPQFKQVYGRVQRIKDNG